MRVNITFKNAEELQILLQKTITLAQELEESLQQIKDLQLEFETELDMDKVASIVSEKLTESMEAITNE